MSCWHEFQHALALESDQPFRTFAALERLAIDLVGARLFTLMSVDMARGVGCRFHSNMPDAYPTSGTKPIPENEWTGIVIERQETFVANDIEGIARVFPDFELIRSLGCEAVLNIPIVVNGRVLGTINCLDAAGAYTKERIDRASDLTLPGAACFLLEAACLNSGA